MQGTALSFVLLAAVLHAVWNLAAKRVPGGGARFVWLYYSISGIVCAPIGLAVVLFGDERPQWTWLLAATVTAVLHVLYGIVLQRGYDVGDLSVVYPVARGSGPLLSVLAAVLVLGERPGVLGLAGAALVIAGVVVIGTGGAKVDRAARRTSIFYGLLTGVAIAGYTLWDDHAVNALAVPPVTYFAMGAVLQSAFLAPHALRGDRTRELWRAHRKEILVVGVLSPAAYVLVLFAMKMAPVSLVAPARELSIVFGGLAAWLVLKEANPLRRIAGSVVVLAGIAAIAAA